MRPEAIHKILGEQYTLGFWDFSQAVTNEIPISLNLQGFTIKIASLNLILTI